MSTLFHLPGSPAAALLSGNGTTLRAPVTLSAWESSSGPGREEFNDVQ